MPDINWLLIAEVIYVVVIILICTKVIYDTKSTSKTLGYILFIIFVPIFGVIFYFSFGINYRKKFLFRQKLEIDEKLTKIINNRILRIDDKVKKSKKISIKQNARLIKLLVNEVSGTNLLYSGNDVELLVNGENFFPEMINSLREAKHHIHIEYYIYENDKIGNEIKNILIEKAKAGVEVRFIYDDFGSSSIRKNIVPELRKAGVRAYPFNKIKLIYLANRLNYRNHRKIVIIDGKVSYTGGINVSDKYINNGNGSLYWRDTHLKITGESTQGLQRVFFSDWLFCSKEHLPASEKYFPTMQPSPKDATVQIISSGPDSETPTILHSVLQAVSNAKKEILITTPYYIPDDGLQEAIIIASLSGVDVKLLIPGISDSVIVNKASQFYFEDLLNAGVEIYRYQKGFIHAKSYVIDGKLSSVGTANFDLRSFDLNFEVNALIYDENFSQELRDLFFEDISHTDKVNAEEWRNRSRRAKLLENIVRLSSPFL